MSEDQKQQRIDFLKKEIEKLDEAINKKMNSNETDGMSFAQWQRFFEPEQSLRERYDKELRMLREPALKKPSPYGDKMTLKDFVGSCKDGYFTDYDGYGYYGTASLESNIKIYPSDATSGKLRDDLPFVYWYNK